jgi:D-glycero-D-manno-heptose 1,7-bisphosphate phosphatase
MLGPSWLGVQAPQTPTAGGATSQRAMIAAMPRTVLLDRDGVLNVDRPDYVLSIDQLQLERGAAAGVAALTAAGFRLLVITNQACVGKGLITQAQLDAIHAEMISRLAATGGRIDGLYLCPHRDGEGCRCRKPLPGLIEQAQREHGFDPADTWLVGDAGRDLEAAHAAGCRAALVRTGKGSRTVAPQGVPVFDDLPAFAAWVSAS